MKTTEELDALKDEVEALTKKLAELTEEEMVQVSGGQEKDDMIYCPTCRRMRSRYHICNII